MVPLIVILTVVVFILVDLSIRLLLRKAAESKRKQERKEALDKGLKLDFADEAHTLKRVDVDHPKASILAVDDEEVILDSFRKILVMAGYSIDTVENGPEALTLVQNQDYDFVFTDLKMPVMDGVEVVKAVKHLRPEVDVIVITGYATIETAVETMKYGAMDYIQKPFTEDELIDLVNKFLIRRQDRIAAEVKPKIHLVTSKSEASSSRYEYNVPAGMFISRCHCWVAVEPTGTVRVGLDDFARKILGTIDGVELPSEGKKVTRGKALFTVRQGDRVAEFISPVSGKVARINSDLMQYAGHLANPYDTGWICQIEADKLCEDLTRMRIGDRAIAWYQDEIERFQRLTKKMADEETTYGEGKKGEKDEKKEGLDGPTWDAFTRSFLSGAL